MFNDSLPIETSRYARCINVSRRVRWEVERDVIRGRAFDTTQKYLPEGLSGVTALRMLTADEQRFLSQVQGRTYANMFGLVERFINAKILEVGRSHWLGDQIALEALVRFSEEELQHQALFRRIESLVAEAMPPGYEFVPQPNDVAQKVLATSTWAVLGLTLHIELFTQSHYKESIDPDPQLSPLWKDVFRCHWLEESQHAVMDELEWRRADRTISPAARDAAVNELIALVGAIDGLLQAQAAADTRYFLAHAGRTFSAREREEIGAGVLGAYRYQYIVSGADHPHFVAVLSSLVDGAQLERIVRALAPLRGNS